MAEKALSAGPIQKTPEQLRGQVQLVNQDRARKRGMSPITSIPEEALTDPRGYVRRMHELRIKPQADMSSKERIESSKYENYLADLRAVRKQQRNTGYFSKREGKTIDASEFLNKDAFNPRFAQHVLSNMSSILVDGEQRLILSSAQWKPAIGSKEAYEALVNKVVTEYPQVIYNVFDELRLSFPPERIREIVQSAGSQKGVLRNFEKLRDILKPDDLLNISTPQFENPTNSQDILRLLRNPDVIRMFPANTARKALLMAMVHDKQGMHGFDAENLIGQGYLSQQDVERVVVARINTLRPVEGDFINLLPATTDRQALAETTLRIYSEKADPETIENLDDFSGQLLSRDQMFSALMATARRHPELAFQSSSTLKRLPLSIENATQLLREGLRHPPPDISTYQVYKGLESPQISPAEKEQFLKLLLERGEATTLLYSLRNINKAFDDPVTRERVVTEIVMHGDPHDAIYHIGDIIPTVAPQTIKNLLTRAQDSPQALGMAIHQLSHWAPLHPELVKTVIDQASVKNQSAVLHDIRDVLGYIPESEQRQFLDDLIRVNPLDAIVDLYTNGFLADNTYGVTPDGIIELAKTDADRVRFAPKSMGEFFKRFNPDKSLEEQKTLLIEAMSIYSGIAQVADAGLSEQYTAVLQADSLSAPKERELLQIFQSFAIIKQRKPEYFASIQRFGDTYQESRAILFEHFGQLMGKEGTITEPEIERFLATMKTPVPFTMYTLQFIDSAPHMTQLQDIFQYILDGNFAEWKYGADGPEQLDAFKKTGLLPDGLSLDQYRTWRQDGSTSFFETLSTSTESAAKAVAEYLSNNYDHLGIADLVDDLYERHEGELPEGIKAELSYLGQEVATLNKQIQIQRQLDPTSTDIEDMLAKRAELESQRGETLRLRNIMRLTLVTPDEIANGHFLEGKDGKQKGASIKKTVEELIASASPEDKFVFENVQSMIDDFHQSTGERQNLVARDSSDPKVWVEIGKNPVSSCQSYDGGGHNEALLGYTDPNTKIITLENERGNLIGRSVFRLLSMDDGSPALHLERMYSSSTSDAVRQSIMERAMQISEATGIQLFISRESQTEGGDMEEAFIGKGFIGSEIDIQLHSFGSRAPYVYVDSVAGAQKEGMYSMTKLLKVSRAQHSNDIEAAF